MPFLPTTRQSLKLTCPPFQPIFRARRRRVPGALALRTANFAAVLQGRYGERPNEFRPQGLLYRRASLGRFVNRIYRPIQLTLAPRLQLSFQAGSPKASIVSAEQTRQRVPASLSLPSSPSPALKPVGVSVWRKGLAHLQEGEYHPLGIRQAVRETSRLRTHIPIQMAQRLAARLERVETVSRLTQAVPSQGSQSMPRALPVPQVTLNRTQSIRLEEEPGSAPRFQSANRRQPNAAQMPISSSFSTTEMNVQRLADQVVQVINDRVTARQERLGRI